MSEIHQLMMAIEARINSLEKEKSRLQDHLKVLSQAEQIHLEYGGESKTAEMDQSQAKVYEQEQKPVETKRSEVREFDETLETVERGRSEAAEDEYEAKPKTVEIEPPEIKEEWTSPLDLLRKRFSGEGT